MHNTLSNLNCQANRTDISQETTKSFEEELSELELKGLIGGTEAEISFSLIGQGQIFDGKISTENYLDLLSKGKP